LVHKCSRSSMMIQREDAKGNQNKRKNEKLSAALVEKLFNGAHCGVEELIEIQFFGFFILIFLFLSDFVSLK
jgi:hypothetical protein